MTEQEKLKLGVDKLYNIRRRLWDCKSFLFSPAGITKEDQPAIDESIATIKKLQQEAVVELDKVRETWL